MGFSLITDEAIAQLRSRIGKPIKRVTEPFYREINEDACRRFAHAIGDDNPLYTDVDYASKTKWGTLIAPPTILYSTDNVVSGAVEGLAGVHAMFAGTDWTFHQPLKMGTRIRTQSSLKDMVEHKTRFAGRSFQQIYHVEFFDQNDVKLAEADSWCFRTERDTARESGSKYDKALEKTHVCSEEELQSYFDQYRREKPRGAQKRLWKDVQIGDEIDPVLKGPYTVTSAVAFMQAFGSYAIRNHRMAFRYYESHPKLAARNDNNVPEPPARVHWDNDFARTVGVPAAYDFGPERIAWHGHMLTDWMGDDGFLRKLKLEIRRHNPVGDAIWCRGVVTNKKVDDQGRHLIECELLAENQNKELSMKGRAEVELPAR
jgi:acyl dehydratase